MTETALLDLVHATLEDIKAIDVITLDVAELTTLTDHIIICTGRSPRHVKSIADRVVVAAKSIQHPPLGVEGEDIGDWVLVDLNDIILHIMTESVRKYYELEKLWSADNVTSSSA